MFENLNEKVKKIVDEELQKAPLTFIKLIETEMTAGKGAPSGIPTKNTTNVLRNQSGKYAKSYLKGNPESLTEVITDVNGGRVIVGTKRIYAAIHEYGGFIKGKPITPDPKKPRQAKTVMEAHFWKMFAETKHNFYLWMALSIRKKGGVNIEKRETLAKATKEYEKTHLFRMVERVRDRIIEVANG
jgi:hypothetical protein